MSGVDGSVNKIGWNEVMLSLNKANDEWNKASKALAAKDRALSKSAGDESASAAEVQYQLEQQKGIYEVQRVRLMRLEAECTRLSKFEAECTRLTESLAKKETSLILCSQEKNKAISSIELLQKELMVQTQTAERFKTALEKEIDRNSQVQLKWPGLQYEIENFKFSLESAKKS
ncbi:hypothetical protein R1flu_016277 [Riccia fluitans]|uniref:Uncharacterized protein n=1 Tax=Riccia fluitans TaxID=41844 RepID=A0ABD1YLE1_9MARC